MTISGWCVAGGGGKEQVAGDSYRVAGCLPKLRFTNLTIKHSKRSKISFSKCCNKNLNPARVMDEPEVEPALCYHLIMQVEFVA